MSWECYCPAAVERSREHMPGSYGVCPYCERTREHSELRQAAQDLVDAVLALEAAVPAVAPDAASDVQNATERLRGRLAEDHTEPPIDVIMSAIGDYIEPDLANPNALAKLGALYAAWLCGGE